MITWLRCHNSSSIFLSPSAYCTHTPKSHTQGHIGRQIGVARWQRLYDWHLKLCRIAVDMDFPPGMYTFLNTKKKKKNSFLKSLKQHV